MGSYLLLTIELPPRGRVIVGPEDRGIPRSQSLLANGFPQGCGLEKLGVGVVQDRVEDDR